jgi:hypothetical protein
MDQKYRLFFAGFCAPCALFFGEQRSEQIIRKYIIRIMRRMFITYTILIIDF